MSAHCFNPMDCPTCNPAGVSLEERVAAMQGEVARERRPAIVSVPPVRRRLTHAVIPTSDHRKARRLKRQQRRAGRRAQR
jgi:hypothetical protein